MMKRLAIAMMLWVSGCKQQRDIVIQMGPEPDRLSDGFKCEVDDPSSSARLIRDAIRNGAARVSLVIDLFDLGDQLPGCRAEDLVRACTGTACSILETGPTRYCNEIAIPTELLSNDALMIASIKEQLGDADALRVTANAPDRPVLVRVALTRQPCSEIQDGRLVLDIARSVGCAYSCPFVPDTIQTSINVGLDTFTTKCRPAVQICTGFPDIR